MLSENTKEANSGSTPNGSEQSDAPQIIRVSPYHSPEEGGLANPTKNEIKNPHPNYFFVWLRMTLGTIFT